MSTTTTSDWNDAVAKVMTKSGASKEAAEEALRESGGDVDGAVLLLLLNETSMSPTEPPPPRMDSGPTFIDDAPSVAAFDRKKNRIDNNDDDAVAKTRETPMSAPSLRTPSATVTEKATDDITENEDGQENQRHDGTESGEGAASIESPPSYGNNIITSNNTATSSIRIRAQIQPHQTQPGAVRVAGFHQENQFDSTFISVMTTTVESGCGNADSEDLISAQLVGDIPQAEIVEEKQQCSTRVKIWSGVAVVLALTVAVVLGTVLTQVLNAPTSPPSPQEILKELESLLSSVSFDGGTALQTPSSPQNKALNWLANNNTKLEEYPDDQKIQRYALATLFSSTDGASWNEKDEWMSGFDECRWYNNGTSLCKSGSVETLSLSGNNLVGTIPDELALMSNLCDLYLDSNSLTGTIPSEVGLMSNLAFLDLSDNSLIGTIPSQIALLSTLYGLWLYNNNFTGKFTCPAFIDECWISCDPETDTYTQACRSL